MENGPFIIDLPIRHGDFFHCDVSLPEGKHENLRGLHGSWPSSLYDRQDFCVWDGDNSPWWFHEDFTEIHDEHIWLVVFRPTALKNHGWWVTVGMKFDEIPNMEK